MNPNPPPYLAHLTSSQDLITTPAAKRAGFVTAVLEKSKLADGFVRDARTLRTKASAAQTPEDLLALEDIQAALLTAAGVSDKATNYLGADDRREILREYVKNVLEPAGDKFVEELVYRFLLTRGDTLGGKVRNLVGLWAQRHFTHYIVSEFSVAGRELRWLGARHARWQPVDELTDPDQVHLDATDRRWMLVTDNAALTSQQFSDKTSRPTR